MFDSRVPRKIFGPQREGGREGERERERKQRDYRFWFMVHIQTLGTGYVDIFLGVKWLRSDADHSFSSCVEV
jgi:hypothetical protein